MRAKTVRARDLATQQVVTVQHNTTLAQCAQIMRNQHVGSLIVVQDAEDRDMPIGIVTDRDIVIGAVAVGLDPSTLTASDVMTTPIATVRETDDILDALAVMRERGVRRLAVVGANGALAGIIAVDNLLAVLAEQLDAVVGVIKAGATKETALRQ
jgi:signal-transduction protein with cAMP-binding, CBS, and nucleotidyltransferase domain